MRLFLKELGADDGALLAAPAEGEEPKVPEDLIKHVEEELAPSLIRKMCRETSKDDEVSRMVWLSCRLYSTSRYAVAF